jgi:outer membrane lipoprotein carrier protein
VARLPVLARLRVVVVAALIGIASPLPADAAGTALDRFLEGLTSLRTGFTQTLTDSRGRRLESVRGTLVVQRPGRFRWEVRPVDSTASVPTQVMVADGRNVWFHDLELEQVTVRPAGNALTATPAMLLSGAADIDTAFIVTAGAAAEGLEWVRVRPRRADAEFREARLGFSGGELRRMELEDRLGQKASLKFEGGRRNAPVDPAELRFTPPPGVDLLGTPRN